MVGFILVVGPLSCTRGIRLCHSDGARDPIEIVKQQKEILSPIQNDFKTGNPQKEVHLSLIKASSLGLINTRRNIEEVQHQSQGSSGLLLKSACTLRS